jgi:6-phosphofructokinase
MADRNKIGILTGGGDVPGLNSVIKSVVYRGSEIGRSVIGIRRGWKGLTHLDLSDATNPAFARELTRESTRTIDRSGGTILHTSRTNPRRIVPGKVPAHISQDRLKKLHFDGKYYDFTPIVIEIWRRWESAASSPLAVTIR